MVPVDAAVTAQVLTTALDIVSAPDLVTAASRLGWIVDRLSAFRPLALRAPLLTSRLSAPLAAAVLRARKSHFSVARRLKYTTSTLYKRRADRSLTTPDERAARLPALLWPRLSIPLIPEPDRGARRWRLALPACLLLTGGQTTCQRAVDLLGFPAHHRGALFYTHAKINTHPACIAILDALSELAEHLNQHPSPIDYARRRAVFANQEEFITLHHWSSLRTRRQSDLAQAHIHAQRWLYEALTGNPAEIAPSQIAANDFRSRTAYSTFRMRLLPSETKLLQEAGADLLHINGIDEPLTWQPTFRFSPDQLAALPGRDPDDIDIATVHQAFLQDKYPSAKQIATACGTTSEHIRYILDEHPIDRPILTISSRGGRVHRS
ncbi:hypothetical protein [Nonomuraea sp. NPDC048901]|uniref:hypothetical protein n=1 Tax=Nonomuraea sp. NPDC048901 TaxID=3155627 RepID=UPI0033F9BF47